MFFKKLLSFSVAALLTFCTAVFCGQNTISRAQTIDPVDKCFLDFITEDTGLTKISYTHSPLYDANLQENGRQYLFTAGEATGYALISRIVMNGEFFYEVEELFYNKQSPFAGVQGLPVYITFNSYLDYVDGVFYRLPDRSVVGQSAIDQMLLDGFGYRGNGTATFTNSSVVVNYSTKNTDTYSFPYNAPNIVGNMNGSCCANTAGAIVIGYYDRFKENLMPNFQAYYMVAGIYVVYKDAADEYGPLVATLVDYMAVDGVTEGTTFTGFQNGMERYVEEKGYTYSTSSVMSWGNLDFDEYAQAVEQEIPVALFLNTYSMLNGITENNGADTISSGYSEGTHVEVGIGYKVDTYYNANGGVITTRRYLKVISGLNFYGMGYLNINASGEIEHAIAIDIN